jgi:glycogen synthase
VAFIITNTPNKGFNSDSLLRQLLAERFGEQRFSQSCKNFSNPPIVTHSMLDEDDGILKLLRNHNLLNSESDRVKVVYFPEFLKESNPLFPIDYDDFVSGSHMGIFPSFYEPWGYTPAETISKGVSTVGSNLSGFGCFIEETIENPHEYGIKIIDRRHLDDNIIVEQLAEHVRLYCQMTEKKRISEKNNIIKVSPILSWNLLGAEYIKAWNLAKLKI